MSAPLKRWRVTVLIWLSHDAVIEAASEAAAEDQGRRLWADDIRHGLFRVRDGGIDGFVVEEVLP